MTTCAVSSVTAAEVGVLLRLAVFADFDWCFSDFLAIVCLYCPEFLDPKFLYPNSFVLSPKYPVILSFLKVARTKK